MSGRVAVDAPLFDALGVGDLVHIVLDSALRDLESAGGLASAVDHDFITGRHLGTSSGFFHLHREHDALAAECACAL